MTTQIHFPSAISIAARTGPTAARERETHATVVTMDEPFLAREPLLVLTMLPPVVTLLIADLAGAPSLDSAARCLLATWLCTVIAGFVVHGVVNFSARRLLTPRVPRSIAFAGIGASGLIALVVTVTIVLRRITALSPHLRAGITPFVGRAIAIGAIYVAVARIYSVIVSRSRYEARRAREQEHAALTARLAALQSRTNPHFLFNTLNAIASLIGIDAERAERMVERLAGVLQYSIETGARRTVSLGEELSTVRDYLEIEQARFGDRLRSRIDVAHELESVSIPPMLLQPLVENAVLHGLASRDGAGEVVVSGRRELDTTVLTVSDDGVGPGGSLRVGSRVGLRGARERLELMYGDAATMEVRERPGGGFECELRVPSSHAR